MPGPEVYIVVRDLAADIDPIIGLFTDLDEATRVVQAFTDAGKEATILPETEIVDVMSAQQWRQALADDIAEEREEAST